MGCSSRFDSFVDSVRGFELRLDAEDSKTAIGFASVFYDGSPGTEFSLGGGVTERIMSGAFDRAILEDDVRVLFNHDPSLILGRTSAGTASLRVLNEGLEYRVQLPDTGTGRDVAAHLGSGNISGSSFGFSVLQDDWSTEGGENIRSIRDVRLYDVGPVTYPAYTGTTATLRSVVLTDAEPPSSPVDVVIGRVVDGPDMDKAFRSRHLEIVSRIPRA